MTMITYTPFESFARRLALCGLFVVAFCIAAPVARAQTATCGSLPTPIVLIAAPTAGPESGISTDYMTLLAGAVEHGFISGLQARVGFVIQRYLADMAELARQQQLLGTDETGAHIMQELAGASGATDWLLTVSVSRLGSARIVSLKLLDLRRGAAIVRSRSATLPTGVEIGILQAEVAAMARGMDCQLRSLRMTPVIPLLQLALSPQPARGKPGDAMTVTVRLVDLAAGSAPEPNKDIVLEYTTPQGQKSSRTVRTDATGVANDTLILGAAHPRAGLIKARFVRSDGYPRDAVPLNYYVTAPTGDLTLSTGKAQLLPAGTDTVRAELTQNAAPVANHALTVGTTGGALASTSVTTNSAGVASVQFAAPGRAALVDVNASTTLPASAGNAQAAVSYVVDPGVVMSLQSGGDTLVFGGSSLKVDLERDRQPVVGATVTFTLAGGGTLSAPSAATDTVGRAEVVFAAPSRQGATTVTASVTLDGQTYTRSVTTRYTDPTDAITREIADVKEALYLAPSDATLSRLDRLRSTLQGRGEGARYEAMLGDTVLVRNQLFCTHQRAHGDCVAGARSRGETTLGLLKSATAGSSVAAEVFSRSRDSLYRCPYPMFSNQQSVFSDTATINDISGPPTYQFPIPVHFFLSLALNDDGSVKGMSWSADDPTNPRRFAYGFVPSTATGPTWTGRSTTINVESLYGSFFMAAQYQASASSSTASFTVNNTAASGFIDLYQASFDNVPYTATVRFQANITLPAAPSPTMCNHASLPTPD